MSILLAGDIGGTKTSLRVVESEYSDSTNNLPKQTTLYEKTYPSQKYSDLAPMLRKFVKEATDNLNQSFKVEKACFGIAGPVVNNVSELTNLNWYLDGDRLRQDLSLNKVTLINDYAAIGYGILGLTSDDLYILQDVQSDSQAPIAILGAGTGLGAPTPYDSGNRLREQGISKAGNRRVRALAIEIAWAWLRYQPQSKLSRWFLERFAGGGSRMRRIGIVALARRLLIDLWRFLEYGVVPEGAQVKALAV